MNKKGAELSMGIGKLITLIIVVIVIVVVIIGLLGLDVYGFIKNLPDFLNGTANPPDLSEKAVVYGKDVTILLNDGYGRCIIAETESQDSWLEGYGVKGWELYTKYENEWKLAIPKTERMDRVTSDQNKEPMGAWIRLQVIRQDLIEACYFDESDFKNTEILGEEVKLLLGDEDGKCTIYESKEQPALEHYGIKKTDENFVLYELDENGKWQMTAETFNDAQIKDAEIANSLIQKEKEIKDSLSNFVVQFCASGNPTGDECMTYDSTGIGENRMYGSKIQNTGWRYDYGMYYIFEKNGSKIIKDSWRYFKDVVSEKINEINSKDQEFIVFRKCVETETGLCYLSSQVSGLGVYGVRDGVVYVFNKETNKWAEISWIKVSGEELQNLVYKKTIKQELSRECF